MSFDRFFPPFFWLWLSATKSTKYIGEKNKNYHRIRTTGHSALLALWSSGIISFQSSDAVVNLNGYAIDYEVLYEKHFRLSNEEMALLSAEIDPLW